MSLRSLGLSKDPKDAQRQPSCFPDANFQLQMTFATFRKVCSMGRRNSLKIFNFVLLSNKLLKGEF